MKNLMSSILRLALLTALVTITASNLFAQQAEVDKTLSPYFFVKSTDASVEALPLKSTSADVNIAGVIADVTVTQQYANEGSSPIEAIYVFPASTRAAIYDLKMRIGNRTIQAEIQERKKARKNYEVAKASGKRVSLLEQERPNVFQMNVANIMPGDVIKVELKYTELLVPEEGVYQFVYPIVVGPRYVNTGNAVASANQSNFTATPYLKENEMPPYAFDLEVYLSAGMPIQHMNSNSHKVSISHERIDAASIRLDPTEQGGGNRDFIFEYGLAGGEIESGLLLYEHEDENFFLAMMQPPKRVEQHQIPPREFIFVLDVSGSMRGFPMKVSKKLMRDLITGLRPSDRFNVLLFAGTSGLLANESITASHENINEAINFIDNQEGGGATNLLPALERAMGLPRCDVDLSRSVVVVTDGYVSVEKASYDLIRKNLNQANLFSFGIGSGINRHIIEGMAHVGGGEPMIITEESGAHAKAEQFRKYINRPVLTQVQTSFEGLEVYDVEPSSVPDVLAERPVILFGKYKGSPKGKIKIKGFTGGATFEKVFDVAKHQPSKRNAALRSLWARERIKLLDDYSGVMNGDAHEKEVVALGLQYNLMTAYTSFIAIDYEQTGAGENKKVKQPLPLPQGVTNAAVGFDAGTEGVVRKLSKSTIRLSVKNIKSETASLPGDFEMMLKKKAKRLSTCFDQKIKSEQLTIQLSLNATGKVVAVQINGKNISSELQIKLRAKLLKWQFINWQLEGERAIEFVLAVN